jgi:hypothetical protein
MIGLGRRNWAWTAMVGFTVLMLAGCGADGTSTIHIPPPQNTPVVSGMLCEPNDQFAAADQCRTWPHGLSLPSCA